MVGMSIRLANSKINPPQKPAQQSGMAGEPAKSETRMSTTCLNTTPTLPSNWARLC